MRILFLNQFFPPDPAPTGMLMGEVAEALRAQGHEIDYVATRNSYRGGHGQGGRMWREGRALGRMLLDGIRRPRAGLIVSSTSPPCLLVVATLVAAWHRARSIHWIMDLYPEIAVALGEVRDGLLARILRKLMGFSYRRCTHVVALDADMAAGVGLYGVKAQTIRPWVFAPILARPPAVGDPEPPWTWVYSGNLGRAHEWETLLAAQAIVERRDREIRLLFQGGGPSWPAAQARARELGLQRCEWRGYADEAELPASLLRGQVTVVTQRPAARGMVWPSKLALAMTLPRPILWVGPKEGAVAGELAALPHCALFAPGEAEAVADWLLSRKGCAVPVPPDALFDARTDREDSLAAWRRLVGGPTP